MVEDTPHPENFFPNLPHEQYVERAIQLAREAGERGDDPYGSLLVDPEAGADGEILMEEHNAVVSASDVTHHPELRLAERAARELSSAVCQRAIMYTSTEPCPMCAGGIRLAGLAAVVHSVSAARAADLAGHENYVASAEIYERTDAGVRSLGPVLPEDGAAIHETFR